MGKLKLLLILLISVGSSTITSQDYKFGKVSKEELLEKSYPEDSSANASVLYEKKYIKIEYDANEGFQVETEVFKRIKLYNKEGFDHATNTIYLYKSGGNSEKISGLKGVTYTLRNGKIVETKLKKDGIFDEEFSENYDISKFTMPSLQEGSVIEYRYNIISPFLGSIDRIALQYSIPMKKQEIKVSSPEYYKYKKFSSGFLSIDLKETTSQDKITFVSKSRSGGTGLGSGLVQTSYSQNSIDFKLNIDEIIGTNVPAFKEEPYSGNARNYISSISYELSYVKFPNENIDYRSTTWEDVVKKIYGNERFGNELSKSNYYKEDINQILGEISNPLEKTLAIYSFIKNHMTWNQKRSVLTDIGVKKAYREKIGNSAEINLMLTSMLSYAKLDANPVMVSTSDRVVSLFPNLNGFNYVVTRVRLPDDTIMFLDATDKFTLPNILPDRVLRGVGRLIDKTGKSELITFRSNAPSKKHINLQCELDAYGAIKGKMGIRRLNYNAYDFRASHASKNKEALQKRFEKNYGIEALDSYEISGVTELGKGVSEKFNFTLENQAEVIEDELFFSPLLFLGMNENVFKSNERKYPIDFGRGFSTNYMLNIKLPEGYQVVEIPKSGILRLPENMGSFSYRVAASNGVLQVVINETISKSLITSNQYPALKEFYNQIIEKENEQVVLKRI